MRVSQRSSPKPIAPNIDLSRAERITVRLAFLVAFAISAYLAWSAFKGGGVPGCGPESDCDKVLSSRWGYVLGIPVSALALPVYALSLALLSQKVIPWRWMLPIAGLVLAAACWFVGLQAFAIRAFCKFCMTAHVAGAIAALMLLRKNPLPAKRTMSSLGLSAAMAALLIAAQLASAPPAPIQVVSAVPPPAPAPLPIITNTPAPAPDPTFTIVEGQFTLNLKQVPVSGLMTAPKKLVKLFDYTCHHCRDLHHLLAPVKQKYSNELAVISLPMPLDANCNSIVKTTQPSHENACAYTRMALAVFFADPAKFEKFTDWFFTPARPPALAAARAFAEELAGAEAYAAALKDPRLEEQIKTDVNIYVASSRLAKRGAMPQMLFERGASIGAVRNAAQLDQILYNNLGLGTPPVTNAPPALAQPGR